ncbi:MAG: hypothetical protein LBJ21_04790 [Acidobacteriota bacterium]|jgi:type II secretory pathway component PulK|nr:hypothetical protein [Acidobacteriota bacterium]
MKNGNESGVALIAALLILVLMGAMLHVFVVKIHTSQKMIGMDMQQKIHIKKGQTATGG